MWESIGVCQLEGKGRGVLAHRGFAAGEVIERAPVVVMPANEYELLNQTLLRDYYFDWRETQCAIPLGLSLLYNHSETPNAEVIRHYDTAEIEFVALRDITPGEEITHKYVCPPWFPVQA